MTGVAYMNSCRPKVTNWVRSRYLVVSADTINPHDMAWNAIRNVRNGNNSRAALTCSEAPFT